MVVVFAVGTADQGGGDARLWPLPLSLQAVDIGDDLVGREGVCSGRGG